MSSYLKVGLFAALLIAICCTVTLLMIRVANRVEPAIDSHAHQWLHDKLDLTESEEEALESIELKYGLRRKDLELQFQERKAKLASILFQDEEYSERVTEAVKEIHLSHGALQQLSIQHYYDMLEVLSAENRAKLKSLAADALSQPE